MIYLLQFIQVSIAVLLLRLLAFLKQSSLRHAIPIEFELPMFQRGVIINLLPYLTVGITGLIFNTLCLANVDAAFFQASQPNSKDFSCYKLFRRLPEACFSR
jgi:GDP-fucose transporter C1